MLEDLLLSVFFCNIIFHGQRGENWFKLQLSPGLPGLTPEDQSSCLSVKHSFQGEVGEDAQRRSEGSVGLGAASRQRYFGGVDIHLCPFMNMSLYPKTPAVLHGCCLGEGRKENREPRLASALLWLCPFHWGNSNDTWEAIPTPTFRTGFLKSQAWGRSSCQVPGEHALFPPKLLHCPGKEQTQHRLQAKAGKSNFSSSLTTLTSVTVLTPLVLTLTPREAGSVLKGLAGTPLVLYPS